MEYYSCLNPVERACFLQNKLDKYFDDKIQRYSLMHDKVAIAASEDIRIRDPLTADWSKEMMGILCKDEELIDHLKNVEFPMFKNEELDKKLTEIVKVIASVARERRAQNE